MDENCPVLQMKNVYKSFGVTKALDNVSIELQRGEVLGLIGENGAGKSTLMKILSGAYKKDEGDIYINGDKVEVENPKHAQQMGISIVYQELTLFPDFNSIENIFINCEHTKTPINSLLSPLDFRKMENEANKILSNELAIKLDSKKLVMDLNLSMKQHVEIARSLSTNAEIFILDEPTAALEETEREQLFLLIKQLTQKGRSIIYVSHHLDEVLRICDRVTILRDGKNVASMNSSDLNVDQVINYMIGKSVKKQYPKEEVDIGTSVFEIKNLSIPGVLEDISFSLRQGEVLGIAGLEGSGKSTLIRSLFGLVPLKDGVIYLNGRKRKIDNPRDAICNKIAYLPAERKTEGLFLDHGINWNITIASLRKISKILLNLKKEENFTNDFINELDIQASRYDQSSSTLSGGNQQKVMLARWLMSDPDLLIMEEPTRGIDVNAKTEVYRLINRLAESGKSVIISSTEGPELLGICDRIIVLFEGRIVADLDASSADEQLLTYYASHDTGGKQIAK